MPIINNSIIFLLLLPFVTSDSYTNTLLNLSSGIFYSHLGEAKVARSTLTLLSYVNFTHLNEAFEKANLQFRQSQHLCALISKESTKTNYANFHCERTLELIQQQLSDMIIKDEMLHHMVGQKSNLRKRRGLFNIISHGFKWLFGTPDASDAKYYTESINTLFYRTKHTQHQIHIISSVIEKFNNSVVALQKKEEELTHNFELIQNYSVQTNKAIDELKLQSIITQHMLTLSIFTTRLSNEYDKYIDSINLGRHGILSPQIITPKILAEELTKYEGRYELPLEINYSSIHLYYKILRLHVLSTDSVVIFAIKIPLVNKNLFTLYELIPLPMQHNSSNIFSYIEPRQPFLLISNSKIYSTFVKDLSSCTEYMDQHFLCREVHINKKTEQITCETQLLFPKLKRIPKDCRTRSFQAEVETWKYIKNNQWIYILQHPVTLTIFCDNNQGHMEDVTLHHTGILQLDPTCKGFTELYELETTSNLNRNISHYVPKLDITIDNCCLFNQTVDKMIPLQLTSLKLTSIDLSELQYANKMLRESDEINHQQSKPYMLQNTNWNTIELSVIGVILFIMICLYCYRPLGCLNPLKRRVHSKKIPRDGDDIS